MPVRAENRHRYPPEWPAITWLIKWVRALGRCECTGWCGHPHPGPYGRCSALGGQPKNGTGHNVVLTTAHLDHRPENVHPANLRAACESCHLRYDAPHHAATRRRTREALRIAVGESPLPFPAG